MLPPLRGNAEEIESARQIRTSELLARVEEDLRRNLQALADTQLREEARDGIARLPEVMQLLRGIDDAAWWARHRTKFPPHASKRAYEEYPMALWDLLRAELDRARVASRLAVLETVGRAEHAALEPNVPRDVESALRKSGHRSFLSAGDRIVAIHDGGVRWIGPTGKAVARSVPKGSGQVEAAVIADDGSFVLVRNAGGLHRIAIPDKTLASWPMPPGTSHRGLCIVHGDRFAMVTEAPAVSVRELRDGTPVEIAAATHVELDPYASLERVSDERGDVVFVQLNRAGVTLVARWNGRELAWIARHELILYQPRRAADGSIVCRAGDTAVRLRL